MTRYYIRKFTLGVKKIIAEGALWNETTIMPPPSLHILNLD